LPVSVLYQAGVIIKHPQAAEKAFADQKAAASKRAHPLAEKALAEKGPAADYQS